MILFKRLKAGLDLDMPSIFGVSNATGSKDKGASSSKGTSTKDKGNSSSKDTATKSQESSSSKGKK